MTTDNEFLEKMKICKGMRHDGKDGKCIDLDRHNHGCMNCDVEARLYEPAAITTTSFFMPMVPPTTTHQEKAIHVVNGKPVTYEPAELKAARLKLESHLAQHVPEQPYTGAVQLLTKWCFPRGQHKDGEWKITKPDTDNMIKLMKDCMTGVGFWKNDALVASEITQKFWAELPGIYVKIEELEDWDVNEQ